MMKKQLLRTMLLLFALVAGGQSVWADDFVKVTDASTLADGDVIIIVNETGKNSKQYGLSTTQNSNNRGAAEITVNTYGAIKKITPGNDVQQITLEKTNITKKINEVNTTIDCWMFKVGTDQYLYAASNSSNHLKTAGTSTTKDNGKATISISEGDATILFQGSSGRNQLKYNNASSSNLFTCYATSNTSQLLVQIYKKVAPKISTAEYATFYTPAALDFSTTGITVYTAEAGTTSVTLNEVASGKVPANTPVVLYKAGADGTAISIPVIETADAISGTNDLQVSDGTVEGNGSIYALAQKSGVVGFYLVGDGVKVPAGKPYLEITSPAPEFLGFAFGGETTDVREKVIVISEKFATAPVYNLKGQRVAQPAKGLYIVNGKKVVIK